MFRILIRLLVFLVFVAGLAAAALAYWLNRPIPQPDGPIEFVVAPGSSMRAVARSLNDAGIEIPPDLFVLLTRFTETDSQIKAGSYETHPEDSLLNLVQRMARGDVTFGRVTFIEGWTYQQIRNELRRNPDVRQTLDTATDEALIESLGLPWSVRNLEGLFFPDTYTFAKGTPDIDVLRRAWQSQRDNLNQAWEQRTANHPVRNPYELLILASIVEKETGHGPDRAAVAGVFTNRLRRGMLLQTDPTVIYGMGERYDGRLLRRHLREDSEWNTYTRAGLPPTPIATPGRAALMAAAQPDSHGFYYFVARGDGTSAFAVNLADHNRNVARYIRGQR